MHSERNQASKMEIFGKIVIGLKPLTIFTKNSTLDIRLSSEYASVPEIDTFSFPRMLTFIHLGSSTDLPFISILKRLGNVKDTFEKMIS